jgi:TetR/AcrR family transcriptional regulator, repressor for lfrA
VTSAPETGSRARTRQAIISAAIEVLGQNPGASLGEIAVAADVGRTTLHRYFPERSELVSAVRTEGVARLHRATERARLAEGTAAEAFRRLCQEYFELGPLLTLIFNDLQCLDEGIWFEDDSDDVAFMALVERGHRDGTIDPELPGNWLQSVLWSQLYTGWSFVAESGASRHRAMNLMLRTIDGAIAVRR